MRASDLPSLQSEFPNALQLQRQIARAIGTVQVRYKRQAPGAAPSNLALLKTLFTAANDYLDSLGSLTRSLDVTPNSPSPLDLSAGGTQQMVATRTKQDGTTAVVTGTTTWVSSDPTKATVNSSGLVTAVGIGSFTIKGTFDGVSDTVAMSVVA